MIQIDAKKALIAAGVAAGIIVLYYTTAKAADLGGNCCADLEERIAELEATSAKKGNRKINLVVYGQVNKAMLWMDGDQRVIDNTTDGTRVGFAGEGRITSGSRAGFVLELQTNFLSEEGFTIPDPAGAAFNTVSVRRSAVWAEVGLARVTLGRYDTSTHELIDMSTGNTAVAFRPFNLFGAKTQAGLADVVRGDVRIIDGVNVSASWAPSWVSGEDLYSLAATGVQKWGEFQVLAGVGYDKVQGTEQDLISGVASAKHVPSGLFLTGALVKVKGESSLWDVTGGLEKKLWELGPTTFYGEYGDWQGICGGAIMIGFGCAQKVYGLGMVQNIDAAAMDVYLSYRNFDLGGEHQGMVLTGAKVRF